MTPRRAEVCYDADPIGAHPLMTSFGPTTPADAGAPGASGNPSAPASADVPRRNPLLVVWRGRWIVLSAIVIGMAAAIVYLVRAVPIYESRARVMV